MIQLQARVGSGTVLSASTIFRTWIKDVGGAVLTPSGGATYTGLLAKLTSLIRNVLGLASTQQVELSLSSAQASPLTMVSVQSRR
jgi:hypothetical protein